MMAILVSVYARILIVDPSGNRLYTEVLVRALRAAERDAMVRAPVKADHACVEPGDTPTRHRHRARQMPSRTICPEEMTWPVCT